MLRHVGDHLVGQMTRVRARISDSAGFIEFLKNIKRLLGGPAPSRRSGHLKLRPAVGCRRRKCLRLLFNFEVRGDARSEEHTSELQSLMRISYAVFCLKKKR